MDADPPLVHLELELGDTSTGDPADHEPGQALPAGIVLRAADPDRDLAAIAELYNAVFGRQGDDAVTPERVARIGHHPGIRPAGVLLAFDGDVPVALGVGRLAVRVRGGGERRGAIELLAVRAGYRRRGLAHALLHALLAWLAGEEASRVEASTANPAAAGLLVKHGFSADEQPEPQPG